MSRGASRVATAIAVVASIAASLLTSAASADARLFHFEIPGQPMSQALRAYARICGEEVIFTESVVLGIEAAPLMGDYSADDALSRLLAGTRLIAQRSPSGALMIRRRPTQPSASARPSVIVRPPIVAPDLSMPPARSVALQRLAEVVVTGSRIATRSYTSDSPLVSVGAPQIAAAGQVSLDAAIGQMPQFSASQGQTEVGDVQGSTGFEGGQSYSDLRGLGPQRTLVLLDGQRLVPTNPNGSVDLNVIPMALIDSVDVITGGASAVYGSDAMAGVVNFRLRDHFQGIQLAYRRGATTRGDGQETSVSALLGGNFADNRGNAVVDLEYSERGAITGADRPFFSDYLNFSRGVARPPEGIYNAGELGGAIPISAVNAVLAGYPGTQSLAGSGNYGGYVGINSDGTLFTTRAPGSCVENYRGPVNQTLGLHITPSCTTVESYLGPYFAVQVPMRRYNLFARSTFKINDGLETYAQIYFMHSTSADLHAPAYAGPGKFIYVPQDNPFITANAALQTLLSARANPSAGPLAMEDWLTVFGRRFESFDYNDYQATGGLKGVISATDLTWNLFGSYGQTLLNNAEQNAVNLPALESILYGTANYQGADGASCVGYAWDPLGAQPMSKGCLEYVSRTAHNANVIAQKLFEADLSGTILALPAGDLKFALGADYRGLKFTYSADSMLNPAFNVMPAPLPPDIISPSYDLISSTGGTQNVREMYGELLVPILKDMPLAKNVAADLGLRHSQYDVFGGTNAWKADFHWQLVSAVTLRGGFERAIRAPSLQELYNPIVQALDSISVDPCEYNSSYRTGPNAARVAALCQAQGVPASALPTFTYGVESAPGIIQGNPNLKPEIADTYSLGFVLTPSFQAPLARELGASVDYYHIKINGAIGDVGLDAVLSRCFNSFAANPDYSQSNFYCQQIQRDSNGFITLGKEFSLNIGSYVTDGVDLEWHWGFALGSLGLPANAGRVRLQSYISYLRSLQVAGVPGIPSVDFAGSLGDSGTVAAADGTTISDLAHPKWKATTTLGYTVGHISAALRWRYIGSMADLMNGPGSGDPGVGAYSYFDLDTQWQVIGRLQLAAGLTNLADKGPPRLAGAPLLTDAATYDVVGRTYYVGFKADFD